MSDEVRIDISDKIIDVPDEIVEKIFKSLGRHINNDLIPEHLIHLSDIIKVFPNATVNDIYKYEDMIVDFIRIHFYQWAEEKFGVENPYIAIPKKESVDE